MDIHSQNIFIVSGPAGSGKDSVIEALAEQFPIERVITTTTRQPRSGESDGHPYYFVGREVFKAMIHARGLLEYSVNENDEYYGVTHEELDRVLRSGKVGIWKMDWKGVVSAKKIFPSIRAIFITAPLDVLEARLRRRDGGSHDERYFSERMAYTREWMKHEDVYDIVIVNEESGLAQTVRMVAAYIRRHLVE